MKITKNREVRVRSPFYTEKEAAEKAEISESTVRKLREAGEIKCLYTTSGELFYHEFVVEHYLYECVTGHPSPGEETIYGPIYTEKEAAELACIPESTLKEMREAFEVNYIFNSSGEVFYLQITVEQHLPEWALEWSKEEI